MARVVIENLSKTFKGHKREDVHAVAGLNLTVEDKELLVLVGPSGCGKTTTLRLIAGLEDSTDGSISIDGRVVNQVAPKDRDIAMVFQHHALYPHLTARENLAFGLKLRKHPAAEIERRVGEAAELLDLADCLDRRPAELSGGQSQRVALGRALVRRPKVFLLDEPLSNLDAPMRAQMRRNIAALHSRLGATMIYVTHDQAEALALGSRIAVLRDGALQQAGPPMDVYRRPASRFVAGFLGSPSMNFIPGKLARNGGGLVFETAPGDAGRTFHLQVPDEMASGLAEQTSREVVLGIRPENITRAPDVENARDGALIEATANVIEPLGAETHIHSTLGRHPLVARVFGGPPAQPGGKISLALDMREAHFFDPKTGRTLRA